MHATAVAASVLLLAVLVPGASAAAPAVTTDRLGEALALLGLSRDDLGCRPRTYWSRFPDLATVPHKLRIFDDLYAEPLRLYDVSRTMARAAEEFFAPAAMAARTDALFQTSYYLAIGHKVSGFRAYSANLHPQVDTDQPMVDAVQQVWLATGSSLDTWTFGGPADWPRWRVDIEAQLASVPVALQRPLAALLLSLLDAYRWQRLAVRRVDPAQASMLYRGIPLATTLGDGQVYYPEMDDIAAALDEESLYYAAQKVVQAGETAARELVQLLARASADAQAAPGGLRPQALWRPEDLRDLDLDIATPIGRVVVRGTGNDILAAESCVLVVDLGGDDTYRGPVGAVTSQNVPVALCLDLGGADRYQSDGQLAAAQGGGVLGVGVLLDLAGDDTYQAVDYAQGFGLLGFGMLYDESGDDQYRLRYSGQGAGYMGIGLQLDRDGADTYYLMGDGQGFGGPGGVGVLLDGAGADTYTAEADAERAGRGDYHSAGAVAVSNAQGVGSGRRADGADGHAWAGGLGALLDMGGNDEYRAGNWSMGTGYWFGTGLLYDRAGDDRYRSVYFTQGAGAHFCNGALIDEEGNDVHELYGTAGAGLAFGWDFANALFIDKGGDDVYDARILSMGNAMIRSTALFMDVGGNDEYTLGRDQGLGTADFREAYRDFSTSYGPYGYYGMSIGLFLDIGGSDRYIERSNETGAERPDRRRGDGAVLRTPDPESSLQAGFDNYGLLLDVADGWVPDLYLFGETPPALTAVDGDLARSLPAGRLHVLAQPNPFNHQALLQIDVPREGRFSVQLYNALGQVVRRLADGPLASGRHTVAVDAADLPSGVYLISVRGDGLAATERVTLVR